MSIDYPHCDMDEFAGRDIGGCWYYNNPDRLNEYKKSYTYSNNDITEYGGIEEITFCDVCIGNYLTLECTDVCSFCYVEMIGTPIRFTHPGDETAICRSCLIDFKELKSSWNYMLKCSKKKRPCKTCTRWYDYLDGILEERWKKQERLDKKRINRKKRITKGIRELVPNINDELIKKIHKQVKFDRININLKKKEVHIEKIAKI